MKKKPMNGDIWILCCVWWRFWDICDSMLTAVTWRFRDTAAVVSEQIHYEHSTYW